MMKTVKQFGIMATIALTALAVSSCGTLRRHPRHHHHPHRHHIVVIAAQAAATQQSKDCTTFEEHLAMAEPYSYDSTE